MKRGTIGVALSASVLSLALSGGAMAAGAKSSADVDSMKQSSAQWSDNHRVSDLMDMEVKNAQDQDLGTISELLIDKNGKVSHIVLQEGGTLGMGENRYVIPWNRVKLSPDGEVATIDVNKDRLASEFAAFEETATKSEESVPSRSGTPSQDTDGGKKY